jgi:hypothetical protein
VVVFGGLLLYPVPPSKTSTRILKSGRKLLSEISESLVAVSLDGSSAVAAGVSVDVTRRTEKIMART